MHGFEEPPYYYCIFEDSVTQHDSEAPVLDNEIIVTSTHADTRKLQLAVYKLIYYSGWRQGYDCHSILPHGPACMRWTILLTTALVRFKKNFKVHYIFSEYTDR